MNFQTHRGGPSRSGLKPALLQQLRCWMILLLAFAVGCTTVRVPEARQQSEIIALAEKLRSLSPQVDSAEAERTADVAIRYPLQLAQQYHATRPAVVNNVLINAGIHERGLCFQWADDLTAKLMTLHLRTLELHRGVAKLGTKHEHSCVVVTASGQNFTNGLALDAWRYGGKLNWSPLLADKYAWQKVELIHSYQAELKAAAEKLENK